MPLGLDRANAAGCIAVSVSCCASTPTLCTKRSQAAAACLEALGALQPGSGRLTGRGRAMARLPVTPRHARMLLQVGAPSTAGTLWLLSCAPTVSDTGCTR